jgi:hypothetical protein
MGHPSISGRQHRVVDWCCCIDTDVHANADSDAGRTAPGFLKEQRHRQHSRDAPNGNESGSPGRVKVIDVATTEHEGQCRDVRRIASTLFCSADIDPSIVTFAKYRTAMFWGLTEEEVDVRVTGRILQKAASLMTDLHWLATDLPNDRDPREFSTGFAA